MNVLLFLWGLYVGAGIGTATFFMIDDDPLTQSTHWIEDVVAGVIIAFVWAPVLAWVIVEDELL